MGLSCFGKELDRIEFTHAEKKDKLKSWCSCWGRGTHMVQVTRVRVLTGPWRQTESGPFQCGISSIGKFWEMQRTNRWLKWSPSEGHWSQRGEEKDWLECWTSFWVWTLKFFEKMTGLMVEKVDTQVFTHLLLLNFQHGWKIPLSTQQRPQAQSYNPLSSPSLHLT